MYNDSMFSISNQGCHQNNYSEYSGRSREYFSSYITSWEKPASRSSPNLRLVNPSFTGLKDVYGANNTQNIYTIDDVRISQSVYATLVEKEAWQNYWKPKSIIRGLFSIREGKDGYNVYDYTQPMGPFTWTFGSSGKQEGSCQELVRQLFTSAPLDACASLGSMLGMSFKNMYKLSDKKHAAETNGLASCSCDIPEYIPLDKIPCQYKGAELVHRIPILGNAGQTIGAVVVYKVADQTFCLPATVGKGRMCMGKYTPTAHFLNQHLMVKYPSAIILLCQDMRTAIALQEVLQQCRSYKPEEYIITSNLGDNLPVLPWNYFDGHDVVFVPAPSIHCLGMIADYRNIIGKHAGIMRSFRVYPGFLLHSRVRVTEQAVVENSVRETLLKVGTIISLEEQPIKLLKSVVNTAIFYDNFVKWGQDVGFYKGCAKQRELVASCSASSLPSLNPELLPKTASILSDVSLYHTLRPGTIAMLLGAKGSGKTQTALSACSAVLRGDCMWPLFLGGVRHDENIAYVDAETPFDEYHENLQQHDLADKAGTRFFGLSRFAPDLPAFCASFSLNDQIFRDGLTTYLLEHKCRFLILDNLTALMGDAVQQASSATTVLDWVKTLQQQQIGIVFVHHKSETDTANPGQEKARGSQHFEILARSIVSLFSKADVLAERVLSNERVQKSAKQPGLTVGLHFRVSKTAPILDGKTFWLHLPLGSGAWKYLIATDAGGEEIPMSSLPRAEDGRKEVEPRQTSHVEAYNLSPDERKVVEHITSKGSVKREDIEVLLDCKEDKAGKILKTLCDAKIIVKDGASRNTYYKLPDKV